MHEKKTYNLWNSDNPLHADICRNAENHVDGKALLEEILSSYSVENVALSRQVQVIHSAVNFREAPEGKVIARLDGGEILECLDEEQYKGALWYCDRKNS